MGYKVVCLNCQTAYNLASDFSEREKQSLTCRECNGTAAYYPHRFRPPKKENNQKWAVVKYLYKNGFIYQHVSERQGESYVRVKYPQTMREAKEFVEKYKA